MPVSPDYGILSTFRRSQSLFANKGNTISSVIIVIVFIDNLPTHLYRIRRREARFPVQFAVRLECSCCNNSFAFDLLIISHSCDFVKSFFSQPRKGGFPTRVLFYYVVVFYLRRSRPNGALLIY